MITNLCPIFQQWCSQILIAALEICLMFLLFTISCSIFCTLKEKKGDGYVFVSVPLVKEVEKSVCCVLNF